MPAVADAVEPTSTMDDIASFRAGVQNGIPYTREQLAEAVDNFNRFSDGSPPWYVPYLSINHNDGYAFGSIVAARMDGDVLRLSAEDIPLPVAQAVKAGRLRSPSIEFFGPKLDDDGNVVDAFRDEDGEMVPGLVIKCLTFLGNIPPAVKGLGPLPTPVRKFSHSAGELPVVKFSGESMDRQAMMTALQAAGMDTASITDAVPDEVLKAILDTIQQAANEPDADNKFSDDAGDNDDEKKKMAAGMGSKDFAGSNEIRGSNQAGQIKAMNAKDPWDGEDRKDYNDYKNSDNLPSSVKKFADQLQAEVKQLRGIVRTLQGEGAVQRDAVKRGIVKVFMDEVCGGRTPRVAPANREVTEKLLMKCSHAEVRAFADGSKKTGTELEEMMAAIRSGPVVRTFGDQLADPAASVSGMSPERRKQLLSHTPEGKAVVRRETAATK